MEKKYNIELNENEIRTSIQNKLEKKFDILLINKSIISNSNTQIVFFEYSNKNGYALFKKNYFPKLQYQVRHFFKILSCSYIFCPFSPSCLLSVGLPIGQNRVLT